MRAVVDHGCRAARLLDEGHAAGGDDEGLVASLGERPVLAALTEPGIAGHDGFVDQAAVKLDGDGRHEGEAGVPMPEDQVFAGMPSCDPSSAESSAQRRVLPQWGWCRCQPANPHALGGSTVLASDSVRARIEAFNQARGGGNCTRRNAATRCPASAPARRWPGSSRPGRLTRCRCHGGAANAGAPKGCPASQPRRLAQPSATSPRNHASGPTHSRKWPKSRQGEGGPSAGAPPATLLPRRPFAAAEGGRGPMGGCGAMLLRLAPASGCRAPAATDAAHWPCS